MTLFTADYRYLTYAVDRLDPFLDLFFCRLGNLSTTAKIRYDFTDTWFLTAGYRVFEGGVDNGERFAFGWYNFAVVSLGARF